MEVITSFNEVLKEGWDIFDSTGSVDGNLQLQKVDEDRVFEDDKEALKHVINKADQGSEPHKEALRRLVEHNPKEFLILCRK
jgi:hypothetical protein